LDTMELSRTPRSERAPTRLDVLFLVSGERSPGDGRICQSMLRRIWPRAAPAG
jgi:hypothetical protein